MDAELKRVIEIMGKVHGLDVSAYDPAFLKTSIGKKRLSRPLETFAAYGQRLARDPAEAQDLFASLRVSHSAFFRDPLSTALLQQVILPGLMEQNRRRHRKEIRVWCAGCAAGQEAYSAAILLDDLSRAAFKDVPYRIFATDVSDVELTEGREGIYPAEALQNVPLKYVERYFTQEGNQYQVVLPLRQKVDFSIFDLISEPVACPPASIFGDFELAFCSNLLFYYHPRIRERILDKMRACLLPGGYFITGEAEKAIVEGAGGFHAVALPAAVFKKI